MLNYNTPLTPEEAAFAAEHHDQIYRFLRAYHLPERDYYDVVVFGYLRAVRKYLARPELRQDAFSTIAFRAMRRDLRNSREYQDRCRRKAVLLPPGGSMNGAGRWSNGAPEDDLPLAA